MHLWEMLMGFTTNKISLTAINPSSQSRITVLSISGRDPKLIQNHSGTLTFHNISFSYGTSNQTSMAALASVIRSNSSIFFHFGSGTGKTIFSTHLNYGTFISGNTTNFIRSKDLITIPSISTIHPLPNTASKGPKAHQDLILVDLGH